MKRPSQTALLSFAESNWKKGGTHAKAKPKATSGYVKRSAITAVACNFIRVSWARMKLKVGFVPPAGEDLNQDIEKKFGEFLQAIGAGQLFQSKLGPRRGQVLEAGGYKRPQPIPRERSSVRTPTPVRARCPHQDTPPPPGSDTTIGTAIRNCQELRGNQAHLGEILRTHPVLQETIKRQGDSHEVIGTRAGPTSKDPRNDRFEGGRARANSWGRYPLDRMSRPPSPLLGLGSLREILVLTRLSLRARKTGQAKPASVTENAIGRLGSRPILCVHIGSYADTR